MSRPFTKIFIEEKEWVMAIWPKISHSDPIKNWCQRNEPRIPNFCPPDNAHSSHGSSGDGHHCVVMGTSDRDDWALALCFLNV